MSDKYALEPGTRAALTDLGLNPASILRRAGLRPDLLNGGPVWLDPDDFYSLWRAMEAEIDHPNLPLLIEEAFSPEIFAPSVFAAVMSPDLNTAAQRIAIYKRLVGPLTMDVDIGAECTTISLAWPLGSEPPPTFVLTELLFWVGLARNGTRTRLQPLHISSHAAPEDMDAYREVLGVAVDESSTASITFAAADAARPFLTANEAVWQVFEPQLRRRLIDLDLEARMGDRVGAILLELLPVGRTTVAEVASELAVSRRTLHRELEAEGVSFQHILDSTRERLARHYLENPGLSAAQIAFLLGYAEPSSFYRAFRKWTGETPEQARSMLLGA